MYAKLLLCFNWYYKVSFLKDKECGRETFVFVSNITFHLKMANIRMFLSIMFIAYENRFIMVIKYSLKLILIVL
jgi:hypothetical protein